MNVWIAEYGKMVITLLLGILIMTVVVFLWRSMGYYFEYLAEILMGA